MPLPTPKPDESRDEWLERCMGNEAMNTEFPDQEQRAAVCNRTWQEAQADKGGEIETKSLESLEIKNESTGEVEAIIATLEVVDKDFEVITKDAIPSGSKVTMSSYGHDIVGGLMGGGTLPVGRGKVFVEDNKAIFRGKIFVTTDRGRDTLEVLKEMGADQQWSFGFRVIGSEVPDEKWSKRGAQRILTKLDVFEVSPVVIGAGIGTRTVAAKAVKQAVKEAVKEADDEAAAKAKAEEAVVKQEEQAPAIPLPAVDESEETFMARCMADATMQTTFPEHERQVACSRQWVESPIAQATQAAADAVSKQLAEEAEAKRLEQEAEAARKKEAAIKLASTLEFERFQRTLHRPFVRG
jgi:hypothetical protein